MAVISDKLTLIVNLSALGMGICIASQWQRFKSRLSEIRGGNVSLAGYKHSKLGECRTGGKFRWQFP